MFCHQFGHGIAAHIVYGFGNFFSAHQANALFEDDLALVIHDIVEFQNVLPHVEVAGFDFLLGFFQRLVDPRMDDGFTFLQAKLLQHRVQTLGTEDAHQVIVKGEIEA